MDNNLKLQVLQRLANLESSGGKFRNHPTVDSGINEGTHAVSSYGLMPATVYDMAQKYKPFGQSEAGQQVLQTNGDPEKINQVTSNPDYDKQAASALWDWNQTRLGKYVAPEDLEDAGVYAHRRGVAGALNALKSGKDLEEDPYVKQYLNERNDNETY